MRAAGDGRGRRCEPQTQVELMGSADEINSDPFAEPPPRSRSFWRWLPLIVGLAVFEATGNPMLGVAMACLRFGERDVLTAVWLRRRDPNRARGRACGWFHLAWGFAKVGMMSFLATGLTAALILIVDAAFKFQAIGLLAQIQGALLTAMGAIVGFLVTSYIAIATALIGRVKVWVSPTNHHAREARRWPPVPRVAPKPESNRVMAVAAFSAVLTLLLLFLAAAFPPKNLRQLQAFLNVVGAGSLLGLVGNLWFILWIAPRIFARSPAACWPESIETPSLVASHA